MFGKKKSVNQEITVHVIEEPIDYDVRKTVEKSSDGLKNWVVMEPEIEGRAGWNVDITGCIRPSKTGLYVDVIRGSNTAIKYDTQNHNVLYSMLTADEQKKFIEMKIFKAHYGNILKDLLSALKPYLIILAVVVVVSVAISAYDAYALSKIPAVMYPIQTGK